MNPRPMVLLYGDRAGPSVFDIFSSVGARSRMLTARTPNRKGCRFSIVLVRLLARSASEGPPSLALRASPSRFLRPLVAELPAGAPHAGHGGVGRGAEPGEPLADDQHHRGQAAQGQDEA